MEVELKRKILSPTIEHFHRFVCLQIFQVLHRSLCLQLRKSLVAKILCNWWISNDLEPLANAESSCQQTLYETERKHESSIWEKQKSKWVSRALSIFALKKLRKENENERQLVLAMFWLKSGLLILQEAEDLSCWRPSINNSSDKERHLSQSSIFPLFVMCAWQKYLYMTTWQRFSL